MRNRSEWLEAYFSSLHATGRGDNVMLAAKREAEIKSSGDKTLSEKDDIGVRMYVEVLCVKEA